MNTLLVGGVPRSGKPHNFETGSVLRVRCGIPVRRYATRPVAAKTRIAA